MYAVRECTALHPDEELTICERAALSHDPRTGDQCCSIEDGWVKHRGARCEHNLATMVCFRGTQAPTLKPHANGKEGRKTPPVLCCPRRETEMPSVERHRVQANTPYTKTC